MNTQQFLAILQEFGVTYTSQAVQAVVTLYIALNPTDTDAQLVAAIDGAIKHEVRGKIGWLVDFIWPFVSPQLDPIISADVAVARATPLPSTVAPVDPNSPAA